MELIDKYSLVGADGLFSKRGCKVNCDNCSLWSAKGCRVIIEAPTVDAVPVVHGRWVWDIETHGNPMYCIDEDFGYRCSECKVWADEYGVDGDIYEEPPTHILHFCPNCGAKMDSEE